MPVANAYTEKPILPYERTRVEMTEVIDYLRNLPLPVEVKRATYIVFRFESANGSKGVNHNYVGIQADGRRWPAIYDQHIIGTVVVKENMTKKERRFVAFDNFKVSVDFLAGRLQARGLYVGGTTHKILSMPVSTPLDLCTAYEKEWVTGDRKARPSSEKMANFLSMYKQAEKLFV